MSRSKQVLGLIGWLVLAFLAAAIGARASIQAGDFYQQLVRPSWAPPAQVFGPVWSTLYLMMGIASWLIWRTRDQRSIRSLALYVIQLAVNALWSWVFFAWHEGRWAFVVIIVLWFLILATTVSFWRIRALAGALFLPYLCWVSFASVLAYHVWRLNPKLLGD